MKSAFRFTHSMVLICASTVIITGCATSPHVAERVTPPAAEAKNETKKIIVARVNNAELSMDALVKMMNNLPELSAPAVETLDERKKRALDSLILLELAYQRAALLGINADPAKVQLEIDNFITNIGGEKKFAEYLTRHSMTEADVHADVERGFTINAIYTREVVDRVTVPEEDLKREYETNKKNFIRTEKVTVIDVYLLKNEGKVSQKKATELLKMIKADPNQDPWKLVLDGTFMVRNLLVRKDKEKELYDAAKKLKPHGLSSVIQTPGGPHIIKLKEYSPERLSTFDEAKPLIIEKLNAPLLEKRTHEWEEELKKDAKIELVSDTPVQQEQKKP